MRRHDLAGRVSALALVAILAGTPAFSQSLSLGESLGRGDAASDAAPRTLEDRAQQMKAPRKLDETASAEERAAHAREMGLSGFSLVGDGLGSHTAATELDMANHRILNLETPSAPTDGASKGYVDGLICALDPLFCNEFGGVEEDVGLQRIFVPIFREIKTINGVTGGGDLSRDLTLQVDGTVVRTSRKVLPGEGLTGGGNLSNDLTLSVDGTVVRTIGAQNIGGDKVFTGTISVPAPQAGDHAVNLDFLDGRFGEGDDQVRVNVDLDGRYVPLTRRIDTEGGIKGGGPLSADRTLELEGQARAFHDLDLNGLVVRDGAGVVKVREIAAGVGITVGDGAGASGNPTISVNGTVVRTSGNQDISGTKTFTGTLRVNRTPSAGADVTNKAYVDERDGGLIEKIETIEDFVIDTRGGVFGGPRKISDGSVTLELEGAPRALYDLEDSGLVARTAEGGIVARTIEAGTGIAIENGDGLGGNPRVGVNDEVVLTRTDQTIVDMKTFRDGLQVGDGGLSGFDVTIRPVIGALTGDRVLSLANGNTTLVEGTMVPTSRSISTANGISGGGNLAVSRTLSLTGQALAFHRLSADGLVVRNGTEVTARAIAAGTGIAIENGDGLGGNPRVSVNDFVVRTDIDQTIGGKKTFTVSPSFSNQRVTEVGTPQLGSDAATKDYVDGQIDKLGEFEITGGNGIRGGGLLFNDNGEVVLELALDDPGFVVRDAVGNLAARRIVAGGGGITVLNEDGVNGDPKLSLDNSVVRTTGLQTIKGPKTFQDNAGTVFRRDTTASGTSSNGIILQGSASGNGLRVTITPPDGNMSKDGKLTLADGNTTLVDGIMVPTIRRISTSSQGGLTGGGDLSDNRTLALTGQALAFHSLSADGLVVRNGGSVEARAIAAGVGITVANGDGASGNPTISVNDTVVRTDIDQSIGGKKTFTVSPSFSGQRVTEVGTPQAGSDAATKDYVDTAVSGLGEYKAGTGLELNTATRTFSLRSITAGYSATGALAYSGTARVAGRLNGGSVNPTESNLRVNFEGNFHATNLNATDKVSADLFYGQGYFYSSDARLKTDVASLDFGDAMADLRRLRPVSYDWKSGGSALGLIAQEVEEVFPTAVSTDAASGLKSVDYAQIISPMLAAIRDLDARLAALEGR